MIRQTVMDFKIESTKEQLTAHGGLALLAEYHHGLGLRQLSDRHLPPPGSNRGDAPSGRARTTSGLRKRAPRPSGRVVRSSIAVLGKLRNT